MSRLILTQAKIVFYNFMYIVYWCFSLFIIDVIICIYIMSAIQFPYSLFFITIFYKIAASAADKKSSFQQQRVALHSWVGALCKKEKKGAF